LQIGFISDKTFISGLVFISLKTFNTFNRSAEEITAV